MSDSARNHHEREANARAALTALRNGRLTKLTFEQGLQRDGSRLAPAVDKLRNAFGFDIDGDGSLKTPYALRNPRQAPSRVEVRPKHKDAYYETVHWETLRHNRRDWDDGSCVLCRGTDELVCHHVCYNLFAEAIQELMTVCSECHELIHSHAGLKFPSGMTADHVRRLGFEPEYESWLLPPRPPGEAQQMELF